MSKKLTPEQLASVRGLSSRDAATLLGVGKSTINDARNREAGDDPSLVQSIQTKVEKRSSSLQDSGNGSLIVETQDSIPQTKDHIDERMRARGFDPDEYDFTYRFSEWEAQSKDGVVTMYSARAGATKKPALKNAAALDAKELLDAVRDWSFTPVIQDVAVAATATLAFADPQIGKVDIEGGSDGTVERVMNAFTAFVEKCKEEKPAEAIFADLGDGLENFQNTSSQRETNDLDLTSQVRVLRRLQAEGLRMIRPHVNRLVHVSVPSNHGSVRIAPQQQASTASNDWGLEVSHQLEDVFSASGSDVKFIRPVGEHAIAVSVVTSGTILGFTHGDQSSQAQMPEWFMKQAFAWDSVLRDVDILVYGHHHNQATAEVSKGRWAIGAGSTDPGSAWFTNRTGRSATSGMTSFLTADGKYWDLELN